MNIIITPTVSFKTVCGVGQFVHARFACLQEETVDEFEESCIDPLTISPCQMNLDRTQFLLRSYLRVCLQKIEKYMFHILKTDNLRDWISEQKQ
ncbi:uncharacterized protein LOC119998667 [Tripterygium wilfordii]|uniref:uncharacterized protein LOC119998667 n=1 Tax=Tripterygium wilfordii TaxID=458696 RepID=UPI0018F8317F|nr:uncharacterized protein LOC119998667 [Tripterygium wilfordii]